MKNIAIFASGSGTNAEAIIKRMQGSESGRVVGLLSNKADAYALSRAKNFGVETFVFSPKILREEPDRIIAWMDQREVELIILAGFMLLVPPAIVERYTGRIINIHPALLPLYGGKGMYGDNVHQAVIEAGESQSGITIHYVNKEYDKGAVILQAAVDVLPTDTPELLAEKIHALEHQYFPEVVEKLCNEE